MNNRKPIIGIISRPDKIEQYNVLMIMENYRKAIIISGGIPISILPPQLEDYNNFNPKEMNPLTEEEKEIIVNQLKLCDGILLPGGLKRYEYDRFITNYCIDNDIPVLGICLGMQLLSTHIERDTLEYTDDNLTHSRPGIMEVHKVILDKSSKLYNIIGEEEFYVNSRHKFKVTTTDTFDVAGYSPDGIIEAIERKDKKFAIGVQWHPEDLMNTKISKKIFNSFIESCKE